MPNISANYRLNTHLPVDPSKRHNEFRSECPPAFLATEKGPTIAYLELTPACNSRCLGCINESFISDYSHRILKPPFRQRHLNAQQWLSLFDRMPETINTVILSGGEPSLHPEFLHILDGLELRHIGYTIFTNGRWPDPKRTISFLEKSQYFRGFLVSLHGSTAVTHEAYMGVKGIFDEILSNIRGATRAGLPVTTSTVLSQENLQEIEDLPALAIELGVMGMSFNRFLLTPDRLQTFGNQIKPLHPRSFKDVILLIETLQVKYEGQLLFSFGPTIPQCFSPSSSQGCSAGDASFVIDPWGNIKPCLHADLVCGNLVEEEFADLWENSQFEMWRKLTPSACSSCSALSNCGGGCKAMTLAWNTGRDPLMTDPLIDLTVISSSTLTIAS